MRILCASNLHLGRRVSGLPDHAGLDPARISAGAVWNRLANAAVTYDVDAVLLAGDVIDRESGLFEPVGALQEGLGVLGRQGIPVVAIAGDEDFDALPRAIEALRSDVQGGTITLLDARRSSTEIGKNGDRATVIGVSQTGQTGVDDLLAAVPEVETSHPRIVMLHASLTDGNAPEGTFQPVRLDALAASGTDIWVLGAQPEPDIVVLRETTAIEPGATLPAGGTETGMHGATLVELFEDGQLVCDLIPLAPVQFEDLDLDLGGLQSLEDIEGAVVRALTETLESALAADAVGSLAAVLCPVSLTGATPLHGEIPALMEELARTLAVQQQGVVAAIQSVEIDTRPEIDIDPLLGRPDPVGELARLLQALEEDAALTTAQEALLQRSVDRLIGVHRSRVFAGVAADREPDVDIARIHLRREAWNVLDALVRQRGVD
jgi:DNA repair protein SbcD/Mre11